MIYENAEAQAIFDMAIANRWYGVVPAIFKSSLKEILVEKYIRAMIQESPENFSEETNADNNLTQWRAVSYRVATMRTLSNIIVAIAKHRDEILEANGGKDDAQETAAKCDEILTEMQNHCSRQIGRITEPSHQQLIQEVIDKIYDDAESELTSS